MDNQDFHRLEFHFHYKITFRESLEQGNRDSDTHYFGKGNYCCSQDFSMAGYLHFGRYCSCYDTGYSSYYFRRLY